MFLLPTRQRPQSLIRFFKHYKETGATAPGVVWLDSDNHDQYLDIELPDGWFFIVHERLDGTGGITKKFYEKYPNEPWYGLLGDDVIPRTMHWDKKLIEAAGSDGLSYADDMLNGKALATHPVIGGDLVRELGWLALPGCKRTYIDNALMEAAKRRKKLFYCADVILEHMHFSNGKALLDSTYIKGPNRDKEIYEAWLSTLDTPITFVCINQGNYCEMGAEYVNRLYDMVMRNLPGGYPGKFVCYTDNNDGLCSAVVSRPLPGNLKGWWNKLFLFKKGEFQEGERIIFLDLDTVITGALDEIVKYEGDFACLRDFYHPERFATGIMMWKGGFGHDIWDNYEAAGCPQDMLLGDLEWLNTKTSYKPDIIQNLFPKQICSYKDHAADGIPKGVKIVCFHGNPRPHQCMDWVKYVWKVGGGSPAELEIVCNTDDGKLIRHIKHALTLPYPRLQGIPEHDGHAVIVGGAPSLEDQLWHLKGRIAHGQAVFATNGTYNWLKEHGVTPDCHVMIDARREMTDMVPDDIAVCYYSSQMHPDVFRRAKGKRVVLWHSFADGIQQIIGENTGDPLVGGGSSVGLKAISLAYILGYRHFHLYGMDGSYRDELHHAYPQALNDNENIFECICADRSFKVAPWMVTQAEQFKDILVELQRVGCSITIHGDGLLPWIAECHGLPKTIDNQLPSSYNQTHIPQEIYA